MTPTGTFKVDYLRLRERAHQLAEQGWTSTQIASELEVDLRKIQRYLALPKPLLGNMGRNQVWREDAACESADEDWFFPTARGMRAKKMKDRAREICGMCQVSRQCLDAALSNYESWGVWGGVDFSKVSYVFDERTGQVSVRGVGGAVAKVS